MSMMGGRHGGTNNSVGVASFDTEGSNDIYGRGDLAGVQKCLNNLVHPREARVGVHASGSR